MNLEWFKHSLLIYLKRQFELPPKAVHIKGGGSFLALRDEDLGACRLEQVGASSDLYEVVRQTSLEELSRKVIMSLPPDELDEVDLTYFDGKDLEWLMNARVRWLI